MPKINEIHLVDMTPEKFLEACTPEELTELNRLLSTRRFIERMKEPNYDEMSLEELLEEKEFLKYIADGIEEGSILHENLKKNLSFLQLMIDAEAIKIGKAISE